MLQQFDVNDRMLNQKVFMDDEVQYNLVHRICESDDSTCLKTSDETMIFAQTKGHNAWLWISKDASDNKKNALLQELIDHIQAIALPGISGEPETAALFSQLYSETRNVQYNPYMTMEAYYCSAVKKPLNVEGAIQQAAVHDADIVAEFLAGFSERAYGVAVDPASQIPAAKAAIETGNLYLWIVDHRPVSMANIAHRSPRHARINAVFTPAACRKQGYASAIVAELCSILEAERLIPMLYADCNNVDANKVYRNIGFVESGKIADIKFK